MPHESFFDSAKTLQTQLQTHRRWLHSHAEVGFELLQTKAYVKEQLEAMGYAPVDCGKAGLVVIVGGKKPGKTFLLRADMDALPITEESGLDFACTTGNMHACGHDMHTAMLLGAAQLLKERESEIRGQVKLMFQPAEEIFEGSEDMIQAGVLENPAVDAAMMIHVMAGVPIPAGTVVISAPGVSAPAADYFTIHVQGKGCHGSVPHQGIDPITTAAHILLALQEIHARELPAGNGAVLTVGSIHAGNAGNVIADSAGMQGTMRTYDEDTRANLKQRITEIAQSIATAFRAVATVTFGSGCPTLLNDGNLVNCMEVYLTDLLGARNVISALKNAAGGTRGGGSEDFAYVSHQVPSLMLALAAGEPDKGFPYQQHHPKVRFDENVLCVGAAVLAQGAIRWLAEH